MEPSYQAHGHPCPGLWGLAGEAGTERVWYGGTKGGCEATWRSVGPRGSEFPVCRLCG